MKTSVLGLFLSVLTMTSTVAHAQNGRENVGVCNKRIEVRYYDMDSTGIATFLQERLKPYANDEVTTKTLEYDLYFNKRDPMTGKAVSKPFVFETPAIKIDVLTAEDASCATRVRQALLDLGYDASTIAQYRYPHGLERDNVVEVYIPHNTYFQKEYGGVMTIQSNGQTLKKRWILNK